MNDWLNETRLTKVSISDGCWTVIRWVPFDKISMAPNILDA
jgi:hypothetical protein